MHRRRLSPISLLHLHPASPSCFLPLCRLFASRLSTNFAISYDLTRPGHVQSNLFELGFRIRFSRNKLRFKQPIKRSYSNIKMESTESKISVARGSLIVLEGLDRSGKSSQCAKLVSYLQGNGLSVEAWRFPDRTTVIGQMISSYLSNESHLDDKVIHLLFSANRWEKRALMESKLTSGTTLIVDRYSYSGVAFSAAKGLDFQWCKAPEEGLLAPDLVLYLDIPPEKAAERGGYGTERYEKLEFQKKVAEHYYALRDSSWEVVDGCIKMESVEEQLREIAMNCISKCQNGKPLVNLWSGN